MSILHSQSFQEGPFLRISKIKIYQDDLVMGRKEYFQARPTIEDINQLRKRFIFSELKHYVVEISIDPKGVAERDIENTNVLLSEYPVDIRFHIPSGHNWENNLKALVRWENAKCLDPSIGRKAYDLNTSIFIDQVDSLGRLLDVKSGVFSLEPKIHSFSDIFLAFHDHWLIMPDGSFNKEGLEELENVISYLQTINYAPCKDSFMVFHTNLVRGNLAHFFDRAQFLILDWIPIL